ncbi:MAG: DMT family transporter [Saprospiraceae bacterium]|nr:DMT family transporter [Saprospiraceae bacterium]
MRLMLLSTLTFAVMQTLIKALSHIHVFEVVFFRAIITAFLAMGFMVRNGVPFKAKNSYWVWWRTVTGIIGMVLFFLTIQKMPFGAAVSIKYLSPVFTAIIAVFWLKERIRNIQWLLFFIAFIGLILLKGIDTRIDTIQLILGIIGAIAGGFVYVIIRKIGTEEHPLVIVNYYMLTAGVLAGIGMIPVWTNPTLFEWVLLIIIGSLGYYGQLTMTQAFQMESASRMAPIKYMELVYSLIIGLIWFGESYTILAFLGMLLIMGSMLVNLKYK